MNSHSQEEIHILEGLIPRAWIIQAGSVARLKIIGLSPIIQRCLAACRTLVVDSENRPRRDQFVPDSPPHGGSMGQEAGEKWAAAVDLQPTIPKSDRLLGAVAFAMHTLHPGNSSARLNKLAKVANQAKLCDGHDFRDPPVAPG